MCQKASEITNVCMSLIQTGPQAFETRRLKEDEFFLFFLLSMKNQHSVSLAQPQVLFSIQLASQRMTDVSVQLFFSQGFIPQGCGAGNQLVAMLESLCLRETHMFTAQNSKTKSTRCTYCTQVYLCQFIVVSLLYFYFLQCATKGRTVKMNYLLKTQL